MVISSLSNDVMLLRASHSEVKRLVLLALVVVGVVLVAVNVFRGHVVVTGVLIVVRLVSVSLVVLVSCGVVTFVVDSLHMAVISTVGGCTFVVSSVGSLVMDWFFVLAKRSEMRCLVMDRGSVMGS